jgi:TPR repeat protein
MARFDISDCEQAALGATAAGADRFFDLGMMYSTGSNVPIDYVTAHKWFNLAAMNGNSEAIRLRREIAAEMTQDEIAAAQRAARDWMRMGGTVLRSAA